jgi:hypothetical protein
MPRTKTVKNLFEQKFDCFEFDGIWKEVMGHPEKQGAWLIYGAEKHGKTWFALMLAKYLASFERTLYVSAEEGTSKAFVDACGRAGLTAEDRVQFLEYTPLDEVAAKLRKRKGPKTVLFDNITIYSDELKNGGMRRMLQEYKHHLLIFLAHEERGAPYTATARLAKKLAKVVVRVEGLQCHVSGRVPGGTLSINEEQAQLYHGAQPININGE